MWQNFTRSPSQNTEHFDAAAAHTESTMLKKQYQYNILLTANQSAIEMPFVFLLHHVGGTARREPATQCPAPGKLPCRSSPNHLQHQLLLYFHGDVTSASLWVSQQLETESVAASKPTQTVGNNKAIEVHLQWKPKCTYICTGCSENAIKYRSKMSKYRHLHIQ